MARLLAQIDIAAVLLLPLAVFVVSAGFFNFCLRRSLLAKRSATWPRTKGRVIASLMDTDEDGRFSKTAAVFAYEFQVDGQTYQSTDLYPGLDCDWSLRLPGPLNAQRLLANFRIDAKVDVYYAPDNPAASCIYPGPQRWPWWGMGASTVAIALAAALAFAMW